LPRADLRYRRPGVGQTSSRHHRPAVNFKTSIAADLSATWPPANREYSAARRDDGVSADGQEIRSRSRSHASCWTGHPPSPLPARTSPNVNRREKLRRSEAFLAEAQHLSSTGSFSWRVATEDITWSAELFSIFDLDAPLTLARIRTRVHREDLHVFDGAVDWARPRATILHANIGY